MRPPSPPTRYPDRPLPSDIHEMLRREMEIIKVASRKLAWRSAIFSHRPPHFCSICIRHSYCNRLRANELIQNAVLVGKVCPDIWSIWNALFDE